jgi:hypothetical protein
MTLALSKSSATTSVAIKFTKLVVNSVAIDGEATFATTSSTFSIDADLTSGGADRDREHQDRRRGRARSRRTELHP